MSRSLDSSITTALSGDTVKIGIFIDLEFPAGTQRYCTMARNTVWDGNTYTAGKVQNISKLTSTLDPSGATATLDFSLTQTQMLSIIGDKSIIGSLATVRLVPLNSSDQPVSSTGSLILFRGKIIEIESSSSDKNNLVSITISSALHLLFSPLRLRYNNYEQQTVLGYSDDVSLRGIGLTNRDMVSEVEGLEAQTKEFDLGYVPPPIDP